MRLLLNPYTNPYTNLALEEFLLAQDYPFPIGMLWQNEPSVIIGRYQNAYAQINEPFIRRRNIHVARRLTGGGAVYHDLGNLNYTFIHPMAPNVDGTQLQQLSEPILKALHALNLPVLFSGRNDLTLHGKKISGGAQHYANRKVLHHGTLLFDVDLSVLEEALTVTRDKLLSKGIASVRARVANLKEALSGYTCKDFQAYLHDFLAAGDEPFSLTDSQWQAVQKLAHEKFRSFDWVYGQSPEFSLVRSRTTPGGYVEIGLNVQNGHLVQVRFSGDFFGDSLEKIEQALVGQAFDYASIQSALSRFNMSDHFFRITPQDILMCMFHEPD